MKIAIVNQFPSVTKYLGTLITVEQGHQVIWTANNGKEAVSYCLRNTPDLIIMDLIMSVMDGVAAARAIMQATPCAVLILATDVNAYPDMVLEAMKIGVIDVLNTPNEQNANSRAFLNKINAINRLIEQRSDVFNRSTRAKHLAAANDVSNNREEKSTSASKQQTTTSPKHLIAIGASTGGPGAVLGILKELPANFSAPIIVVQHVEEEFIQGLATWFGKNIALNVKIAQDEDYPHVGQVLIAGGKRHLVMSRRQTVRYIDKADMLYMPSVDMFFDSIIDYWPGKIIGILLTGIGWDGASGLKKLRTAGHTTIAQNEKSCIVYGMPKAAIEMDAADHVLAPEQIGSMLKRILPCF